MLRNQDPLVCFSNKRNFTTRPECRFFNTILQLYIHVQAVCHPESTATMSTPTTTTLAVLERIAHIKASAELRYIIAVVSKVCPDGKRLTRQCHKTEREDIIRKERAISALSDVILQLYNKSKGYRKIIEALLLVPEEGQATTETLKIGHLQQNDLDRELGIEARAMSYRKGKLRRSGNCRRMKG
jgi:hypothetical protein